MAGYFDGQALDSAVLIRGEPVLLPQRIDPNTATQAELARIPHIGDAMAQRIIQYRENLISKLAFWPFLLGSLFAITLAIVY